MIVNSQAIALLQRCVSTRHCKASLSQAHTLHLRKEASDSTEMVWVEMCTALMIQRGFPGELTDWWWCQSVPRCRSANYTLTERLSLAGWTRGCEHSFLRGSCCTSLVTCIDQSAEKPTLPEDVKLERPLPEGFCLDGRFIQKVWPFAELACFLVGHRVEVADCEYQGRSRKHCRKHTKRDKLHRRSAL